MAEKKSFNAASLRGIDDLIRHLGNPGKLQAISFILLALNYFPVVFHHVAMAFFGFSPAHECRPQIIPLPPSSADVISMSSYRVNGDVNATSVGTTNGDRVIYRSCDALVMSKDGTRNRSVQCGGSAGEYVYSIPDNEQTVVMEWDLVCDNAYFTHLATTVYYIGVMLGGFVCGYLSDQLGRRPVVLVSLALATVLGTALAFVTDFPLFLVLRFILGFVVQGLHTGSFIMAVELVAAENRTLAACFIQLFWGGAVLALGGVAWLLKDWRHVQLAISLPSLLAIPYFWFMPESLRWLMAKEKRGPAERLIQRITTFNNSSSPLREFPELATQALQIRQQESLASLGLSQNGVNGGPEKKKKGKEGKEGKQPVAEKSCRQGSVKDLFSSTVIIKRSVVLFYIWFAGNVCYFGLTFMSSSLAGNRFVNYTLSSCVEFLAYVMNIFIIKRFGRRNPLCVFFCIAAMAFLGIGLIPAKTASGKDLTALRTAFGVLGKFAAGGSFTLFELLTVEMYPTVLRNVGTGLCSFWGRLGAVLAPQFLSLGLYTFSHLPAVLMGALTLLGGLLTLLLPDTSHIHLPDTVMEITVEGDAAVRVNGVDHKDKPNGVHYVTDPLLAAPNDESVTFV